VRDAETRRQRAERILDAAADLLLRWGYRRTTIDDVAQRAGVGKGTIYLHWRTREALFEAVFQREAADLLAEVAAAVAGDPALVRLPRFTRFVFAGILRRPLMHALLRGDLEVLGKLAQNSDVVLDMRQDAAFKEYLGLLVERGLLTAELPLDDLFFVYQSIAMGFLTGDAWLGEHSRVPPDRMLELLEITIRQALEPRRPPARAVTGALAARVAGIFADIAETTRAHIYQAQPRNEGAT
jgi:AcrR family transcriptional regulator